MRQFCMYQQRHAYSRPFSCVSDVSDVSDDGKVEVDVEGAGNVADSSSASFSKRDVVGWGDDDGGQRGQRATPRFHTASSSV
jgi:hypothetical protein